MTSSAQLQYCHEDADSDGDGVFDTAPNADNCLHIANPGQEDLDGDGGNLPVIDTINLDSGIIYTCEIIILDKTKTPFDTVSNAIEEEKNAHQFFFTPSANLTAKIKAEILDFDTNIPSLPVGLSFNLNTKSNQSFTTPILGSLNMVLSHYDGVPKTIEKSNESDIDINFPLKLK